MKRKISRILGVGLTLALLTSLMVVAPVSALTQPTVTIPIAEAKISTAATYTITFDLGEELPPPLAAYTLHGTDSSQTAVWSTTQANSGSSSALLTHGGGALLRAWVEFTPPTGITLDEFEAAPTTYGFFYWRLEDKIGPQLELTFTNPLNSDGYAEITIEAALYDYVTDDLLSQWIDKRLAATSDLQYFGTANDTDPYDSDGVIGDITGLAALINAEDDSITDAGSWELTKVVVDLGWSGDTQTAYIDDIIIADATHDFDAYNTITITLPADPGDVNYTGVPTTFTGATLVASQGVVGGSWVDATAANVTWTSSTTLRTITANLNGHDQIGQAATVWIQVPGITNPSTIGSYTLTVKTSAETTAVTSAPYSIGAPTVLPLPGVVTVLNPAGVEMSTHQSINAALAVAGSGYTIEVGPGSYDEDVTIAKNITMVGTGGAAVTFITDVDGGSETSYWLNGGTVSITADQTATEQGVVLDGFTITGSFAWGAPALSITGEGVTVQNCVIEGYMSSTFLVNYSVTQTLINYSVTGIDYAGTITNNTINAAIGLCVDTGINVVAAGRGVTISDNTITVNQDWYAPGMGGNPTVLADGELQDQAITTAAGTISYPVTITGNTIGTDWTAGGHGIQVTGGVAAITGNSISGMQCALDLDGGTVTVTDATISDSGLATRTGLLQGIAAVDIQGIDTVVAITNSDISDSAGYAVLVQSDAETDNINILFNQITGNALNIYSAATDDPGSEDYVALNATHNWWGDADGPAVDSIVTEPEDDPAVLVDTSGFLGGAATGSFDTDKTSLLKQTTVGVDVAVTGGTGDMDVVGVANYTRNPQDATPETALAGGFYDVYVSGVTDVTEITVKFYNANVSEGTVIYVWSELQGAWAECAPASATAAAAQGINTFSGYAWVAVSATGTPALGDLAGTVFALTSPAVTEESIAPAITSPTFGADEVSVTPTLIWTAITDATGYEIVVALAPDFLIPHSAATSELNGYVFEEALKYSTTYYWRVRAITADLTSTWTMGMFSTMADPAEAAAAVAPDVTVEAPPAADIDVTVEAPPAADVTVEIAPDEIVQVIPDYLLWVIVAVGALLVIAVIVLIVRTRRVV